MKIAIMGAGGIGGFYGGRLATGGEDVTFIARGNHLQALRQNGLRVESPTVGNFQIPTVQATDDPASVGPVDLVLMSVKTYDLDEASQAIRPMIGDKTAVIPLLNGVDIAERVGALVGKGHLLGGTVFVNANIAEPGLIRHLTMDRLIFGELKGGISDRGTAIHQMFEANGIQAELCSNIAKEIWSKFVVMNAISGVASVVRKSEREIVDDPETRTLLVVSLREGEALARGQGVILDDDLVDNFLSILDNKPPNTKPSMLLDLEQSRRLEVEAIQGTFVRLGKEMGVPTPVNQFIYAALKLHAGGT